MLAIYEKILYSYYITLKDWKYTYMDKHRFQTICDSIINKKQESNGIGTLGEKTVHSVLKNYFATDTSHHEIKICSYVADIYNEKGIIEIQTRNFNKLRRKLEKFLTIAPVTIVYPIPRTKWIRWINPQTGEVSPPRKSPKLGKPYEIFHELYQIKDFLTHPNLCLCLMLLNIEEYRYLDGWSKDKKKGSTRCDRIPTELVDEVIISSLSDYDKLIPPTLGETFTSKDYKKASGIPLSHSQTALNILYYVGAVNRIGKKGNSYIYTRSQ